MLSFIGHRMNVNVIPDFPTQLQKKLRIFLPVQISVWRLEKVLHEAAENASHKWFKLSILQWFERKV